jgi:hypothetical protein
MPKGSTPIGDPRFAKHFGAEPLETRDARLLVAMWELSDRHNSTPLASSSDWAEGERAQARLGGMLVGSSFGA